jgi:hypothetical protein
MTVGAARIESAGEIPRGALLARPSLMGFRLLAAIAVALAVSPAAAEERLADSRQDDDHRSVEPAPTPRVAPALDGLQRLRLHPGRDGLDVTEAARKHPRATGD